MKHYLGLCLVLITVAAIGFFLLRSCTTAADHTIASIRNAFAEVLQVQPQITINQRIVLTQTAPIAELAVVTTEEMVTIGLDAHLELWSMQIPLTEKKATAQAVYRIKAGFDLRQPFSVEINPVTHELSASMPRAKILSVEQVGDLDFHSEDATLNRLTDDDRAEILNGLNGAAHDAAEKSGLKADAEQQVTRRLKDLLTHNGQPFEINWQDATNPPPRS